MTALNQIITDLLDFIDASPSPWHAVSTIERTLSDLNFMRLYETDKWSLNPDGRYYVIRDDSSIILFINGQKSILETGFKIVGAHTDSPGLRIKPHPAQASDGVFRLAVEIYGGPILATFSDRDLSLAGRISFLNSDNQVRTKPVNIDKPLLRLPNVAIHMNRTVNEEGLKFDKQSELPLIFAATREQLPADAFLSLLQDHTGINKEQILSWDLNVYDTQPGSLWGADQEFFADSQIDNLASCHAGLQALLDSATLASGNTAVCAFFDHEEIGSESNKGADGSFLSDILQRINFANGHDADCYHRSLAKSFMISADMAHAFQPSFAAFYEPQHHVFVNKGPVIKINANQRYASESMSEALFMNWCRQAQVTCQKYSHRSNLACGSTIGPMSAAKLGIRTVDVGNPMWAMHSIRESAGVHDHAALIKVLQCFFSEQC